MWLNKHESERWLNLLENMQKEIKEGHQREMMLQKQFINIAKQFPRLTDDFNYCAECSMFHYPGQHIKQKEVEP
jgi:hypothetical protein